jgi:hypothetical protein
MPRISFRWRPVVMLPVVMMTAAALAAGSVLAQATTRPQLLSAAGPASSRPAGHLAVRKIRVGDAIPIEGAITFVRVKRPSGRVVLTRRLPASDRLTLPLRPGRYRLVSWQRLCDGNCGTLDPPSDRCARSLAITPGERLRATIRVNYAVGCVIRLRHSAGSPH